MGQLRSKKTAADKALEVQATVSEKAAEATAVAEAAVAETQNEVAKLKKKKGNGKKEEA